MQSVLGDRASYLSDSDKPLPLQSDMSILIKKDTFILLK